MFGYNHAMKNLRVMGIMSGTSIDGVDYALCEINSGQIQLKKLWSAQFPAMLKNKLHQAASNDLSSWEVSQLHHDLGRFYANEAARGKIKPQLIGLHGQTIFHNPNKKNPATFQLGEPAYLVEKFRVPVVSNFRAADLAAGGEGAPLATIFHQLVFGECGKHICVNNLGGISNVTSINWKNKTAGVLAFDTGPANMLTDFAMRYFTKGKKTFDKNGEWAARGIASETLLKKWLQHPYFKKTPPKSTGRELFGELFFKKVIREMGALSCFDALATFAEFTARSLAMNYKLHLKSAPDKIILTGGGALNPTLIRAIRQNILATYEKEIEMVTSEEMGWPVEAIEPAAFAWLAFLRWKRKAGNLPQTTGAKRVVLCGQISEP
ncbi:MAG: anhydro-N-acetylmuramic acid kinase [Verrucomicrobiota bacterium]|nr:anhydro-N-acetylmuramic acid kinase [Verrucomicrobiota bacterium]